MKEDPRSVTIRTLIVDDEPVARQVLREELSAAGDIEIVGEAEDGAGALAAIARHRPDLVFLDLKMPGLGGFDVVRRLPEGVLPVVVIVTAYDEHAIRAYEAGALDYLLKPVSQERLARTLDRVRALRGRKGEVAESLVRLDAVTAPVSSRVRKIVGRSGAEYYLVDPDEILAFQAEGEIVWMITARRRYMATQPLHAIGARLAGGPFQRVHRGALVNVNHVRKMTPLSSQRWMLTLSNGAEMTVSKRLAKSVRDALQG
ncbi:MAG: response regulator transcription factor [Acidobacteriota bacterium]|nr:response regulator transcription factor [Acidobacteriota bacterium]